MIFFYFSGNAKGWFMYLATWTVFQPNETARLLSPVFKATNFHYCEMRFHYHMFGDDKDILSIKLRTSADPKAPMKTLWSRTGIDFVFCQMYIMCHSLAITLHKLCMCLELLSDKMFNLAKRNFDVKKWIFNSLYW